MRRELFQKGSREQCADCISLDINNAALVAASGMIVRSDPVVLKNREMKVKNGTKSAVVRLLLIGSQNV